MENKFVYFEQTGLSGFGKTKIISVRSVNSGVYLGTIKWYAQWRKYVFQTLENTIFDSKCLAEISNEMDQLNGEHKEKKGSVKRNE